MHDVTQPAMDKPCPSGRGWKLPRLGLIAVLLIATAHANAGPAWIPLLGIQVVEIPLAARNPRGVDHGVRVIEVLIDSPAGRAGLRTGDLITDFAGANVTSLPRFQHLVETVQDRSVVTLELKRNGQRLSRDIRLQPPDRSPGIG